MITQLGIRNSGARRKWNAGGSVAKAPLVVAVKSASEIIPIVFWASFVPWLWAIQAALSSCSLPKIEWIRCGV